MPERTVSFAREDEVIEDNPPASIFQKALDSYVQGRNKKSKTPKFIERLKKNGLPTSKDADAAMKKLEKESTDKTATKNIRKILKPVISALQDYSAVIDTLCNADPMPTAIIWGALKVVIEGSTRFLGLYDTIKTQLENITRQVNLLAEFDELFGESETMQELLQASYVDIIRFWVRVEKECDRGAANRMARAAFSFSTKKLDGIINDIKGNADDISKLVPVVQERLRLGEVENAAEERRKAGIAREEQSAFMQAHLEELKRRAIERKADRKEYVNMWLKCGSSELNQSNHRRHDWRLKKRSPGTCSWLLSHQTFKDWIDSESDTPTLWLKASPGVGKSIICAYAVQEVAQSSTPACSVYQYYTFDDVFTALQVYRAIAEQLATLLWIELEDMPEEIHAFTLRSSECKQEQDAKDLIRMLLARLPPTYLFLDGLDEECDDGRRLDELWGTLKFFIGLTEDENLNFRLWCSSQDRKDLYPILENFSVIEVNKDIIGNDIEHYLSTSINTKLNKLELDLGYQNLILKDLRGQADGCFLWAALMLDWISNTRDLEAIQTKVNDGLPKDVEKYYQAKIKGIPESERSFVSKLLACIVYAKRPLRLDELCEAIAILGSKEGQNIDATRKPFKIMILKLCEPLLEIQELDDKEGAFCSLTHASVRKFLVKNPDILNTSGSQKGNLITPDIMGNVCLKYLWQPCYKNLMIQTEFEGDVSFKCGAGNDIMDQHLLAYAAKYWDRHLDDVPYSEELCQRVTKFIESSHFLTCLQVQSLFVGGKFQWWYALGREWAGPQTVRVFPQWLSSNCGEKLVTDYQTFVGEWGHVLNSITTYSGPYPGEIDRCFYGALGSRNFLQKSQSRYKSFVLEECQTGNTPAMTARYYDGVDEKGQSMTVLKLESLGKSDCTELEFLCQRWSLQGRRPKLQSSQAIKTPRSNWCLYDHPVSVEKKVLARPVPVSLTDDLQYLRIGSQIFANSTDNEYIPIHIIDANKDYFEEIASLGQYVAISTRQAVSDEDLAQIGAGDEPVLDYGEFLVEAIQKIIAAKDASTTASESAPTTVDETQASASTVDSSNTSVSSLVIEDDEPDKILEAEKEEELEEYEKMSDASSDHNTAEMDWSEGSTADDSDGIEDEDQWNDWGNAFDDLNGEADEFEHPDADGSEDSEVDVSEDDVSEEFDMADAESEDENDVDYASDDENNPTKILASKKASGSVESHYTQSSYSASSSANSSDSGDFNEEAHHLETLIFGNSSHEAKGEDVHRTALRIFDTASSDSSKPIFHFNYSTPGLLFHSPPVFHPFSSLLVWPLGGGEILFANYISNTYFTRQLCCSTLRACHIFIKAHFSPCGQFIHFCSLEGLSIDHNPSPESGDDKKMQLSLQITTHRLSQHKTARSPPKLIFKTTISLGGSDAISVSRLPYTLTWRPQELYFTTHGEELDVLRIPLFKDPDSKRTSICTMQAPLYLPRTSTVRNIYYFPPSLSTSSPVTPSTPFSTMSPPTSATSPLRPRKEREEPATIIIGSHSSIPSQGLIVARKSEVQPPIGVYVREEKDLGGWKCKALKEGEGVAGRGNSEGGRLRGKFESFDLKEDCDIVPYLF